MLCFSAAEIEASFPLRGGVAKFMMDRVILIAESYAGNEEGNAAAVVCINLDEWLNDNRCSQTSCIDVSDLMALLTKCARIKDGFRYPVVNSCNLHFRARSLLMVDDWLIT